MMKDALAEMGVTHTPDGAEYNVTCIREALHDASLLDIVATCPACGWKGNSFIYVSEMDVLEAGNHEPV